MTTRDEQMRDELTRRKAVSNAEGTADATAPKFRRRAEARPDEVLDAALDLFVERGFAATRVEDVAKRAGISKGAVYLYFPSKQALLEGLIRRAIAPVAGHAQQMVGEFDGNPREMITAFLRMVAERLKNPRFLAIPHLIMREAVAAPQIAEMYRAEVLDHAMPIVEEIIRQGVSAGYFRPVDPEFALRSIVGPILLHLLLAKVFGVVPKDGLSIDRMIENHVSILFDGLSVQSELTS